MRDEHSPNPVFSYIPLASATLPGVGTSNKLTVPSENAPARIPRLAPSSAPGSPPLGHHASSTASPLPWQRENSRRMSRPFVSSLVWRSQSDGTEVSTDQTWIEAGIGWGAWRTVRGAERVETARYSSAMKHNSNGVNVRRGD